MNQPNLPSYFAQAKACGYIFCLGYNLWYE